MTAQPISNLLTLQSNRNLAQADENTAACATLPDGRRVLCLRADWQTLARLDGIPGASYSREWRCLTLPATRVAVLCVETIGRVRSATEGYRRLREDLLTVPEGPAYPKPALGQPQPYRHQVESFRMAMQAMDRGGGFGAFLDCGMGKTRVAIDLMRATGSRLSLVILQKVTTGQWADQIAANWPEARVVPLVGRLVDRAAVLRTYQIHTNLCQISIPTVLLLNWEALAPLRDDLERIRFDLVVADEASRLLGRTTQMARAAFAVARRSRRRLALTGTPINNDPTDLYALYKFVDPTVFGSERKEFLKRYFVLSIDVNGGPVFSDFRGEHLPQLVTRMYSCAHRVTMASVGDMPPVTYEVVRLDATREQRRLYDDVHKKLFAEHEDEAGNVGRLDVVNVLAKATRLQQITAGLFPITDGEEPECRVIDSAKTEWLAEYVLWLLSESDQNVIVWTRFRKELTRVMEALTAAGVPAECVGRIDGDTPQKVRDDLRERFNRRAGLRVLCCQVQAASFGLDLPAADLLIYHSLPFSYQVWQQSSRRGYRLGRTRPYRVLSLVIKNSIDVRAARVLRERGDLAAVLLSEGFGGE